MSARRELRDIAIKHKMGSNNLRWFGQERIIIKAMSVAQTRVAENKNDESEWVAIIKKIEDQKISASIRS